jgi:hypothetical protein
MDASMTFDVVIDDKRKYNIKLGEMLSIKEEHMNKHLAEHPSQHAFVAMLATLARAKYSRMKTDFEVSEAQFMSDIRVKAAEGGIKMTEKALENEVIQNKRLLQMRRDLISAQEQEEFCTAADMAFRARKDCLVTLAANLRAHQDTTLGVNKT